MTAMPMPTVCLYGYTADRVYTKSLKENETHMQHSTTACTLNSTNSN